MQAKKGNIENIAILAGIMGAKDTSRIIPLCHNIPINHINIEITQLEKSNSLKVTSEITTNAKTGVEMEALVAVSISCLTIYDMCKGLSKDICIKNLKYSKIQKKLIIYILTFIILYLFLKIYLI